MKDWPSCPSCPPRPRRPPRPPDPADPPDLPDPAGLPDPPGLLDPPDPPGPPGLPEPPDPSYVPPALPSVTSRPWCLGTQAVPTSGPWSCSQRPHCPAFRATTETRQAWPPQCMDRLAVPEGHSRNGGREGQRLRGAASEPSGRERDQQPLHESPSCLPRQDHRPLRTRRSRGSPP